MKQDNLNRVRGILSARQGTEIPKFNPGGSFTDSQFQEWCAKSGVRPTPSTLKEYNALKTLHPNATTQDLIGYTTGQTALPNGQSYSDFTKTLENNEPESTKGALNTTVLNRNNYESDSGVMKIPGEIATDPNTAVEDAARHNEMSKQVVDEMLAEKRAKAIELPEINVTAGMQRVQKHIQQLDEESAAKIEKRNNTLGQIGNGLSQGIQAVGNAFGAAQAATDSNATKITDSSVDAIGGMLSNMGGVAGGIGQILQIGSAAGQIIEGITGGTDQMTAADKFFDSGIGTVLGGWVNQLWGKNSDAFGIDQSMAETVGSSYGGSMDQLNEAARTADKKYGLFSSAARKKANEAIGKAKTTQNLMSNVANTAMDQRLAVQSMGEQAGLAYSMMTDGGYNQKYTYAAKHGGLLEWNTVVELEWEPQVELNWELPTFKEGGSVEFIEELEWIPEFKDGGKTENSDIPEIEETTQKNVIPEGALHKNKHHMEHAEGLTKKGIPVVDEDGEQQAEIEHSEIIFTLEVTKKLEEYYKIFYSEDSTNKEKEQAALDAGKLLVYQILENTEDRTGLIESCKKGGSLTLKKSTDDLIEEVLEWMPTVVIVETEELEEKKEDKSEANKEQSEKDKMKEAIREVLIELLVK